MKKNILSLIIIFIFALIISFILLNRPVFNIYYNGQKINGDIEVELNNSFTSPKIECKVFNKDISKLIKVKNEVDTSKVGKYKIEYDLEYLIYSFKRIINVNVEDLVPPTIELVGSNPADSCSIQTYVEEGYKASDNYDGDLTDKVTIKKENNTIYYSVKDSSDNAYHIERIINASDKENPKIELKGDKIIYLKLNEEYIDPGYNISDNCDAELKVVEDNIVDNTKEGEYKITYTVSDSTGNSSSIERYVYVYDPNKNNVDGIGVIYLTFDDGPSQYTSKILDILNKYNIKATFFVTRSGKDELIKREYEEGHTVALHTYSHDYKTVYSSVDGYFNDLEKVQNRVFKITNQKSMIVRFPGGSSNTVSKKYSKGIMTKLSKELINRGYHYFDWSVCIEDAGSCAGKRSDEAKMGCVYDYFKKGLSKEKINVVLMHDIKYYTADKLEDMIKYALNEGYTFDKITMFTKQVHHKINN